MTTDGCIIPLFNPGKVYLDLFVLSLFDKRPLCPLYWAEGAEFIMNPRDLMDIYSMNANSLASVGNNPFTPGTAWNLNKLTGQEVLFRRIETFKTTMQTGYCSSPGWFEMFIQNDKGEWVTPYPNHKPYEFDKSYYFKKCKV